MHSSAHMCSRERNLRRWMSMQCRLVEEFPRTSDDVEAKAVILLCTVHRKEKGSGTDQSPRLKPFFLWYPWPNRESRYLGILLFLDGSFVYPPYHSGSRLPAHIYIYIFLYIYFFFDSIHNSKLFWRITTQFWWFRLRVVGGYKQQQQQQQQRIKQGSGGLEWWYLAWDQH